MTKKPKRTKPQEPAHLEADPATEAETEAQAAPEATPDQQPAEQAGFFFIRS